ncbi:hypothetical protein [Streptomyces sp. HPF1205]|uniref:SCO2583 family membrane protein n=1 Tax=Streptomyces sp. HPF1205 TaxID=2873262 RepID=UPI001CEC4E76|nr:hypothetical protein [Streptomyces sp. HPF1205]
MSGSGEPPEGTPEGVPGGDDEYRSVVFDESFVRAARIQEFSARERLDGAARAVRVRHVLPRGLARQATALILLIVVAFGFAVYMGVRHPYRSGSQDPAVRLRATVIPLVPAGPVPAVPAASPFAGSAAAHYRVGAEGINPADGSRGIGGYSEAEVDRAYTLAKEYLTDSGLDPRTTLSGDVGEVRNLLDPGQLDQFDSSLSRPADDGLHEATGWLVRFDPAAGVRMVTDQVRVQGTLRAARADDDQLEVAADHTYVYALRGPDPASGVSLFTVRRQLRFRFDHDDLRDHHVQLVQADVAAGPLACAAPVEGFRPVLAGQTAPGGLPGDDPYDHDHPAGEVCAPLASAAPAGPAAPATTAPATSATTATPASATASAAPPRGPLPAPPASRTPAAVRPSASPTPSP